MPIIYLFNLEELGTIYSKNVAVLSLKEDEKINSLKIGSKTSLFNNNRTFHEIVDKKIMNLGLDLYVDIIKKKHTNSISTLHSIRGSYYITVDNQIWNIKQYEENTSKLVEYILIIK